MFEFELRFEFAQLHWQSSRLFPPSVLDVGLNPSLALLCYDLRHWCVPEQACNIPTLGYFWKLTSRPETLFGTFPGAHKITPRHLDHDTAAPPPRYVAHCLAYSLAISLASLASSLCRSLTRLLPRSLARVCIKACIEFA
jgi:hypothetical protein